MLLWPGGVQADDAGDFIRKAREKKLYEARYWHILLHYKKSFQGNRSLIDAPRFFLAPDGKTSPRSELEATIQAMFQRDNKLTCRFPARFAWLQDQLSINSSQLPVCLEFETVISQIKPRSVTLIFPTYHANNPASMFGHTLLAIESRTRLLAHAVNYSALADETNGIFFAVKGLFGFYRGYYSILPYYQKIQQYSDISQRDIWEYSLNLTKPEIRRLMLHLWELRDIYADYYFFDENCSYNLLFLLESARPSLTLTDEFPLWALPIDTIKAIQAQGVAGTAEYRPSRASKIRHKISRLSVPHQKLALNFIHGQVPLEQLLSYPAGKKEKIQISDLVAEYLQYLHARKEIRKSDYQQRLIEVLKIRSKLGKNSDTNDNVPLPPRPDHIHGTRRFQAGVGFRDGDFFQQMSFRPVFSDLTDMDYVHDQGTQIEFANTAFRYYPEDRKLCLEKLDAINIFSITPRDRFFKPWSWKVNTGVGRKFMGDGRDHLIYRFNTGCGIAGFNAHTGLWYALIEPEINLGGVLDQHFALGAGLSAGVLKRITPDWKALLNIRHMRFEMGDRHQVTEISLNQNFQITPGQALNLNCAWQKSFDVESTEWILNWSVFF